MSRSAQTPFHLPPSHLTNPFLPNLPTALRTTPLNKDAIIDHFISSLKTFSSEKDGKRQKRITNEDEGNLLEWFFEQGITKPSLEEEQFVGGLMKWEVRRVQVWFQNRRKPKKATTPVPPSSLIPSSSPPPITSTDPTASSSTLIKPKRHNPKLKQSKPISVKPNSKHSRTLTVSRQTRSTSSQPPVPQLTYSSSSSSSDSDSLPIPNRKLPRHRPKPLAPKQANAMVYLNSPERSPDPVMGRKVSGERKKSGKGEFEVGKLLTSGWMNVSFERGNSPLSGGENETSPISCAQNRNQDCRYTNEKKRSFSDFHSSSPEEINGVSNKKLKTEHQVLDRLQVDKLRNETREFLEKRLEEDGSVEMMVVMGLLELKGGMGA